MVVQLVRHSSVLAQLLTHHNGSLHGHERTSTITPCANLRLKPELHRDRVLPNIHRRNLYCYGSRYSRTRSHLSSHRFYREYQAAIITQPSRLFSTTSLLCNCHKSPPELQQMQRVNPTEEKPTDSHDTNKSSTQLFQLIRTALSEDTPTTEDKDHEHNIQRNIRPAVAGDPEVVTEKVKDLLRGVNKGNRAKLAEAITLSK